MSAAKLSAPSWPESLPNLHRLAEQLSELGFAGGAGREFGNAVLGQRAADESRNIGFGGADRGEAVGYVQEAHEVDNAVGEEIAGVGGVDRGRQECLPHVRTEGGGTLPQ